MKFEVSSIIPHRAGGMGHLRESLCEIQRLFAENGEGEGGGLRKESLNYPVNSMLSMGAGRPWYRDALSGVRTTGNTCNGHTRYKLHSSAIGSMIIKVCKFLVEYGDARCASCSCLT